jgi:hypothetical protein
MQSHSVVVRGTLKADGTLELDEKPNLPPGPVKVVLHVMNAEGQEGPGWWETLERIWKDQEARGYKGKSREEIDAEIAADRAEEEEYEERWRQIWAQTEKPPPGEEKRDADLPG